MIFCNPTAKENNVLAVPAGPFTILKGAILDDVNRHSNMNLCPTFLALNPRGLLSL